MLIDVLRQNSLGMAYNDYLHHIDNDQELDKDYLKKDDGFWIGGKYMLLEYAQESTTWLYSEGGKYYLEITPMYEKHFLDSDEASYRAFVLENKPSTKIELSDQDIKNLITFFEDFV
jgi:hypothetical protein